MDFVGTDVTVLKTVATNYYPLFVVGKVPWFCLTVG